MFNFILLGILQGLTEFLPISSSGHLILARYFFNLTTPYPLAVDAILQLGTIVAVYIYFAPELWQLLKDFVHRKRTLAWAILLGTVPALIVGVLAEEYIDRYLRSPVIVAWVLIIGALLFIGTEKYFARGKQEVGKISVKQGLWVGIAQCLAFIPGFSRSGATIMASMTQGFSRETAARFSFYLSIPIITISGIKKLADIMKDGLPQGVGLELTVGTLLSFVVGLLSIHFLLTYLKKHSLNVFAVYRIAIGVIVLLLITNQ
ncbi:MAG: undecaprenyl-diphosphatase UppP [Candidatus Abawacabacteria bacterium RBG_16_42_10]|uniref:Undecaprenyl-diphosphatase n=1 Tax=Candidatus Abawacabacteria bacterium RBG_16_42_10 TaxID=1817814 RepID=A0A1F4XIW7_9BACT|nr:MAG: undecaprenyl-diphosphatase UppP [Candidatus Abawacabacteria bacterium RBG_16_42_10]